MWTIRRFPAVWLAPVLLPVMFLTLFPVGHALWTSLHQVQLLFPGEPFVGLDNYRTVVTGEYFGVALRNSLLFTLFAAPLIVALGTAAALFLQREFFGITALRSIILLPWVLPGAISAVLWTWMFHPSWGVINSILWRFGLIDGSIGWLTNPKLAFVSIVIAYTWTQIPFSVVLVMAALSTVNPEVIEAAKIDGTTPVQRFFHVVFPQIKSIVVVLLVYNALTAFTAYDLVYAMTGGGPGTATTVVEFYIFNALIRTSLPGIASAASVLLFLVSVALIFPLFRARRRAAQDEAAR